MTTGSLDTLICPEHGWLAHVGVHEAGHAAVAILLGIEFVEVSVQPGHSTFQSMLTGTDAEAGGVLMPTDRPREWAEHRADDALVFTLAGSLSEQTFLEHFLQNGWKGDMEMWRKGTGRTEAQDPAELGPLMKAATVRTRALIEEHRAAILRVYKLFVAQVPNDGHQHFDITEPVTLSYDEVRAAVLEQSA